MGWIKLNCDGSCCRNPGNLGGGEIIRDNNDVVKTFFYAHFGNVTYNGPEFKAILEGIRLYKQLQTFNVFISER